MKIIEKAPAKLIRKPEVATMTSLTGRSIGNKVREGKFPAPVLLDARQVAWVEAEVLQWMRDRVQERDAGVVPPGRESIVAGRQAGGKNARKKQLAERA